MTGSGQAKLRASTSFSDIASPVLAKRQMSRVPQDKLTVGRWSVNGRRIEGKHTAPASRYAAKLSGRTVSVPIHGATVRPRLPVRSCVVPASAASACSRCASAARRAASACSRCASAARRRDRLLTLCPPPARTACSRCASAARRAASACHAVRPPPGAASACSRCASAAKAHRLRCLAACFRSLMCVFSGFGSGAQSLAGLTVEHQ